MHYLAFMTVVVGVLLGGANASHGWKRDDSAEKIARQWMQSYSVPSEAGASYYQSDDAYPSSRPAGYLYPSLSVIPSVSAYPSAPAYPSYAASSYSPRGSQAPGRPQPSGPHSGGFRNGNNGVNHGGQNAAQSSPAGPLVSHNVASSITGTRSGVYLTLGALTGIIAFVL